MNLFYIWIRRILEHVLFFGHQSAQLLLFSKW